MLPQQRFLIDWLPDAHDAKMLSGNVSMEGFKRVAHTEGGDQQPLEIIEKGKGTVSTGLVGLPDVVDSLSTAQTSTQQHQSQSTQQTSGNTQQSSNVGGQGQ